MGAFSPPAGSQDIPHPRTPTDILLRTLFLQSFAALAYAHLLFLLDFRKPHGAGPLPLLLIPAFILLPELLLLQLAFALLPVAIAPPYRRRVLDRFQRLPHVLGLGTHGGLGRLGAHALFAALNAIPLAAVLGAYGQRLGMTYHQMTYVGNLGLDHRNGWTALGGLITVAVTEAVIAGLVVVTAAGAPPAVPRTGILPERERQDRGEARLRWAELAEIDWPSVFELLYVAGIHQIVLGVTNHPVPVLLLFKAWYLWPVAGCGVWYLLARRTVSYDALGFSAAVVVIAVTVATQLGWDLLELKRASEGQVQAWNFRWRIKDQASAKHAKKF